MHALKLSCFCQIIKQGSQSDGIVLFAPRTGGCRKLVSGLIAASLENIAYLISSGAICLKLNRHINVTVQATTGHL